MGASSIWNMAHLPGRGYSSLLAMVAAVTRHRRGHHGDRAALMAARKEPSGRQKVGWTFMTFALLLVEVLAIREDRQEHDAVLNGILAQEVTARSEAKTNFEGIANGIKGTIEQSQKHFDATMAGMKSVLDTTKETKKNTEMTSEGMRAVGAQISLMSNQVRSRTASGDALIAVTRRLTDSLRDFVRDGSLRLGTSI